MAKKKHANTNDLPTNPELANAVELANWAEAPPPMKRTFHSSPAPTSAFKSAMAWKWTAS